MKIFTGPREWFTRYYNICQVIIIIYCLLMTWVFFSRPHWFSSSFRIMIHMTVSLTKLYASCSERFTFSKNRLKQLFQVLELLNSWKVMTLKNIIGQRENLFGIISSFSSLCWQVPLNLPVFNTCMTCWICEHLFLSTTTESTDGNK